jgi:hypothetical protein
MRTNATSHGKNQPATTPSRSPAPKKTNWVGSPAPAPHASPSRAQGAAAHHGGVGQTTDNGAKPPARQQGTAPADPRASDYRSHTPGLASTAPRPAGPTVTNGAKSPVQQQAAAPADPRASDYRSHTPGLASTAPRPAGPAITNGAKSPAQQQAAGPADPRASDYRSHTADLGSTATQQWASRPINESKAGNAGKVNRQSVPHSSSDTAGSNQAHDAAGAGATNVGGAAAQGGPGHAHADDAASSGHAAGAGMASQTGGTTAQEGHGEVSQADPGGASATGNHADAGATGSGASASGHEETGAKGEPAKAAAAEAGAANSTTDTPATAGPNMGDNRPYVTVKNDEKNQYRDTMDGLFRDLASDKRYAPELSKQLLNLLHSSEQAHININVDPNADSHHDAASNTVNWNPSDGWDPLVKGMYKLLDGQAQAAKAPAGAPAAAPAEAQAQE